MPRKQVDTPSAADAMAAIQALKEAGFQPQSIDQLHDYLRLVGIVLGQLTLLRVAINPMSDASARVAAARALLNTKESPESIAERLRSAPMADLTIGELERIVLQATEPTQLQAIVSHVTAPDTQTPE